MWTNKIKTSIKKSLQWQWKGFINYRSEVKGKHSTGEIKSASGCIRKKGAEKILL